MHKLVVIDNNGREYIVKDPQRFYNHLTNFHCSDKKGDNSIHEENGSYFTVTEDLFQKVENFVLHFKS